MRKLIIAILVLALPSLSWAGSQQIRQVVGMAKTQGGSSCMAGTYLFAWDGSHSSGTDFACDGSANGLDGAITGSPAFGTDYGEGDPDIGMRSDAVNEYLAFTDSGGAIVDLNGARTVWMRIYVSATPTGDTKIFSAEYDGTNYLNIIVKNTLEVVATHRIGSEIGAAYGVAAITSGTWVNIGYTWDLANRDHAIDTNGTWDEDLDELSATEGSDITSIKFGSPGSFSMSASEYIQVTKVAVVNGYKAAKPW